MKISFRFRFIEIFILSLFWVGLAMRILHLPVANIVMLVSCPLPLGYYFIRGLIDISQQTELLKKNPGYAASFILGASLSIWELYILWKLLFIPIANLFFFLSCAIIPVALFVLFRKKAVDATPLFAYLLAAGIAIALFVIPFYKTYYFLNLRTGNELTDKEKGAARWDAYSWHLYKSGEFDQALDANTKAKEAAVWEYQVFHETDSGIILRELNTRRSLIETHSWEQFEDLRLLNSTSDTAHTTSPATSAP